MIAKIKRVVRSVVNTDFYCITGIESNVYETFVNDNLIHSSTLKEDSELAYNTILKAYQLVHVPVEIDYVIAA